MGDRDELRELHDATLNVCYQCLIIGMLGLPMIVAFAVYRRWKGDTKFMEALSEARKTIRAVADLAPLLESMEAKKNGKVCSPLSVPDDPGGGPPRRP